MGSWAARPAGWVVAVLSWVTLAAYAVGLTELGTGFSPLVDGWLGVAAELVPGLGCLVLALRPGPRRWQFALVGAGLACWSAGDLLSVLAAGSDAETPFPSFADVGFLLFDVCLFAALAVGVRRQGSRRQTAVWLDSATGGLGVATALAVVLRPVLQGDGDRTAAVVVSVAYPLADLVLVAAVIGLAALLGLRALREWLLFAAGLLAFAAADVGFALRTQQGTYVLGTPLDLLWPLGATLFLLWALDADRLGSGAGQEQVAGRLAVPALATATAATVLVVGAAFHGGRATVGPVAVGLAAATLVAAALRTQVAFTQVSRFGDLRRQATTDDLTALPNRRGFRADVTQALDGDGAGSHALLLLDLDKFKEVNDSLGHASGDELLVEAGRRLTGQLRSGDLLGRLGGDEFALLVRDVDEAGALAVAARLRSALVAPLVLQGISLRTDASIGIALHPQHGNDLDLLLQRADIAMYRAKAARTGACLYTTAADGGSARLRELEELRTALVDGQLVLHYQPKVDLPGGAVLGVEALVRWQHPVRGLLYPDSFLALVEDAGLMRQLTRAVLVLALDQAQRWLAHGRRLRIAVNLSASSLVDAELPSEVAHMLRVRDLPSNVLQLEITEEFLMVDRDRARQILQELRELGIQIAVDDFGTGYSSLSYLRELPVDELKLDRSFVLPMGGDQRAAALVASVVDLAHSLGLRIVAEGVEDAGALDALTGYGCDEAQGFHLSRPLPGDELEAWLGRRALPGEPGALTGGAGNLGT